MALLITYILIALGFSFLCSILEATLLTITPATIQSAKQDGAKWAATMEKLKGDIDKPLSAILTLNTIAHTMGATGAGAQYLKIYGDGGEAIFAAILTLAILVFTEIIPKTLGARYSLFFSPMAAHLLPMMQVSLAPLVWGSGWITKLITRSSAEQPSRHREDLLAVTNLGEQEGVIHADESTMVRNILSLSEIGVTNIMTPRSVIFMLGAKTSYSEFSKVIKDKPFSRVPVYGKGRDEVLGFILRSDGLQHCLEEPEQTIDSALRPLVVVNWQMNVSELFKYFIRKGHHIALVHDEYGTTVGLVTLEDVLETIVGVEIVDEKDKVADLQELARSLWEERASKMGISAKEVEAASIEGDVIDKKAEKAN